MIIQLTFAFLKDDYSSILEILEVQKNQISTKSGRDQLVLYHHTRLLIQIKELKNIMTYGETNRIIVIRTIVVIEITLIILYLLDRQSTIYRSPHPNINANDITPL